MPKFTVYVTTHQYERWDNVQARSQRALKKRLEEEGIEFLGESDKQDTTDSFIDVSLSEGDSEA